MSTSKKLYTWADVKAHSSKNDFWMVIENKVYDVTKFLDEHPGGEEVMIEQAGVDATEAFEEIGHSEDARELLKEMYIGDLDTTSSATAPPSTATKSSSSSKSTKKADSSVYLQLLVPLAVVVAFFTYKYLEKH